LENKSLFVPSSSIPKQKKERTRERRAAMISALPVKQLGIVVKTLQANVWKGISTAVRAEG
jgi:hypothetical protein